MLFYAHPFSSYCMKVLIALYENATPFTWRLLEGEEITAEWAARWPLKRMPVLVDGDREVMESSIIIEYLQEKHPGPVRLIPGGGDAALDVRFMDRFFDNYIHTPCRRSSLILSTSMKIRSRSPPPATSSTGLILGSTAI